MAITREPATIKRYGTDRLYHPAGRYLSLQKLADMIEDDEDFVVRDAKSGEDITASVLKQIISERNHG